MLVCHSYRHSTATAPSRPLVSGCTPATTGEGKKKSSGPVAIMDRNYEINIVMNSKHVLVLYLKEFLKNVQEGCELSGRLIFIDMNFSLE